MEEQNDCGRGEDADGHFWEEEWEDSDKPHPGFGTFGGYTSVCTRCGKKCYEIETGKQCDGG